MKLSNVLAVADAVLYEGYLLYPYRSTSSKNLSRWQFGVLGPPGASEASLGEDSVMHAECLVRPGQLGSILLHLRFLQLQSRSVEQRDAASPHGFSSIDVLHVGAQTFVTWDEAIEQHIELGPFLVAALRDGLDVAVEITGGKEVELLGADDDIAGRILRRRWPLSVVVQLTAVYVDNETARLEINVQNVSVPPAMNRHQATRGSLLGAHLILEAHDAAFLSLLEPPDGLREQAAGCRNQRCWPVLVGEEGATDAILISPIILYDYPAIAPESAGSLFDSTEVDEILSLRVMTLTDREKAEARATDPAAGAIIDRCDAMTSEDLQRLHGVLREPWDQPDMGEAAYRSEEGDSASSPFAPRGLELFESAVPSFSTPVGEDDAKLVGSSPPWWDPGVDASVSPSTDAVEIGGVMVRKGSAVRLHPSHAADAQDLFFMNEPATVAAVFADVDGGTHVAVVLDNDPAADLHEWYGRYLYFACDEIEPLSSPVSRREDGPDGDGSFSMDVDDR